MHISHAHRYPWKQSADAYAKRVVMADGLRGLAALWVVLFHMSEGGHLPSLQTALPDILWNILFAWGDLGVPVFFVLSGFVMAMTANSLRFDPSTAGRFIMRRLIRLSPPYYFAIAVALAFAFAKARALGGSDPGIEAQHIVEHLGYVQLLFASPVINTVFWTLCVEVQFYLAFALLMLLADASRQRIARYVVFGVASLLALLWPLGLAKYAPWPGHFLDFWYAFLAGVLVCWSWLHGGWIRKAGASYSLFLLGIGLVTGSGFAVAVALAALALLTAGAAGKMGAWLSSPGIQMLGLISYSLYLLHNPLTGAEFWAIRKWMPPGLSSELAGLVIVTFLCCVASWLAYLLVERPSMAWSHTIALRKAAAFAPATDTMAAAPAGDKSQQAQGENALRPAPLSGDVEAPMLTMPPPGVGTS